MLAEQSSLQMVIKGVTVDVELNHVILRSGTEENYTDFKTYDLKAKIQYPKTIDDNINILITQGNSRKKLLQSEKVRRMKSKIFSLKLLR